MDYLPRAEAPPRLRREQPDWTCSELKWNMRTAYEGAHRGDTYRNSVITPYEPSIRDICCLPEMTSFDFLDTCNKSIPIYVTSLSCHYSLIGTVLHNYIYRRWFRPYRSEIERGRYICKFITPRHLPDEAVPSQSTIETLLSLNKAICAEVEARRRAFSRLFASGDLEGAFNNTLLSVQDYDLYVVQPLFQALIMIVSGKDYHGDDSTTLGKLPVYLVRTGITDNLSAPITFNSIADRIDNYMGEGESIVKTSLETAIDFVMGLEVREAAAFGLRPDPVEATPPLNLNGELVAGPSSTWVDINEYPCWMGSGEHYDRNAMNTFERRGFATEARRLAGAW